jgi:hypothetical protein
LEQSNFLFRLTIWPWNLIRLTWYYWIPISSLSTNNSSFWNITNVGCWQQGIPDLSLFRQCNHHVCFLLAFFFPRVQEPVVTYFFVRGRWGGRKTCGCFGYARWWLILTLSIAAESCYGHDDWKKEKHELSLVCDLRTVVLDLERYTALQGGRGSACCDNNSSIRSLSVPDDRSALPAIIVNPRLNFAIHTIADVSWHNRRVWGGN